MLDAGPLPWAIHLCDRAVPEFIAAVVANKQSVNETEAFRLATHPAVSRIQLNFAFRRAKFSLADLDQAMPCCTNGRFGGRSWMA
jgi:hypothetical protein